MMHHQYSSNGGDGADAVFVDVNVSDGHSTTSSASPFVSTGIGAHPMVPPEENDFEAHTDLYTSASSVPEYSGRGGFFRRRHGRSVYACCALLAVVVIVIGVVMTVGGDSSSADGTAKGSTGNKKGGLKSSDSIDQLFRAASPTGGLEFNDPNSYQSRALEFVVSHRGTGALGISETNQLFQRFALACIYYATNRVPNSITSKTLQLSKVFPWSNEQGWVTFPQECDWKGVTCNDQGYLTEIDLQANNLTGSFPREVSYLSSTLTLLDLDSNFFYNADDGGNDFLGALTQLRYLYISNSFMQYNGLPTQLARLTNLRELDVSYSLYYGRIQPSIFTNLKQLEFLDLSGNTVAGPLPTTLAQLPLLKYLYVGRMDVRGDLNFLIGMPSIIEAWLDHNPSLSATIPTQIGALSTLKSLSASNCDLSGSLPTQLGRLTDMIQMWFYNNSLTGSVPAEISRLTSLQTFAIEGNEITGTIAETVCSLTNTNGGGKLTALYADCESNTGQVTCSCCTCCGVACDGS